MNPPIERSYWVEPGRLLAGVYPGDLDPAMARDKVQRLLDAGVNLFLDLTDEDWLHPYTPLLKRNPQVGHLRLPIKDLGVPSRSELNHILDTLDAALAAGQVVYVHCWGGVGRTGVVIGCHLAEHGFNGDAALKEIVCLRRGMANEKRVSPETEEQREMVRGWQRRA